MKNSGLHSWLKSAFDGAKKILIGKKFCMNVRALCFAMLELLRSYVREMKSFQDLARFLDACLSKRMLSRRWFNNLIRSVMFIMMFIRVLREGDFSLHLHACYKVMRIWMILEEVIQPRK